MKASGRRLQAKPWKEARWISRSLHSNAVRPHIMSPVRALLEEIQERAPSSSATSTRASTLQRNAAATTSSGYKKLVRALKACSGNITAMTEVARDLLGAGLLAGAAASPDMLTTAVEYTVTFFSKLNSMKDEKEFPGFPRRPRPTNQPASSSGGDQQQADYNDPFLIIANGMFNEFTKYEPYGPRGMPMSMEEYNAQYCGGEGEPPSMAEATFYQRDHGSNGYYLSHEEWAARMSGGVAGADARSFSYGGDYHHGLTPYTNPYSNDGPMVCGLCLKPISAGSLASACRCYDHGAYYMQHAGNMNFQQPRLPPEHIMENPKTSSPSTAAIAAAHGDLGQRAAEGSALSTGTIDEKLQCDCCRRAVAMGYRACGCDACSECEKPGPASDCRPSVLTCPRQHGLTSWVILVHGYTCHFCGGVLASGVPVLSCSLCQVYACPSCVWMHHNTSW